MKYSSERKTKADDRMTTATRRFKNYKAKGKGDYGDVPAKYAAAAPGPTYDHEMRSGEIIEDDEMNEETQYLLHSVLAEAIEFTEAQKDTICFCGHGYAQHNSGGCKTCKKEGIMKQAAHHFKANTYKFEGEELKSTDPKLDCAVCGGKHPTSDHPQSIHTASALSDKNNPSPEDLQKATLDKPLGKKKVLDELGESVGPRLEKNGFTKKNISGGDYHPAFGGVGGGQIYKHPEHGEIHVPNSNGMNPTVVHKRPDGSAAHVGYLHMHPYLNKMGLKETHVPVGTHKRKGYSDDAIQKSTAAWKATESAKKEFTPANHIAAEKQHRIAYTAHTPGSEAAKTHSNQADFHGEVAKQMTEAKKPNFKSNQMTIKTTQADINRKSAANVGMPPPKQVIKSKKDKPDKYKKNFKQFVDESQAENFQAQNDALVGETE